MPALRLMPCRQALPRALAAAALILGACPALANSGTAGDSAGSAATQGSSSYLTPVASWDEEEARDERGDRAGLSARAAAGATEPVGRRRPGMASLSSSSPPPAPARPSAGRFTSGMPVASRVVTSGFGLRRDPLHGGLRSHAGIDLAAPEGAPVVATADGTVSAANWAGGYGLLVAVEHGGGRDTRYAHLSRLNVAVGQRVRKGDVIGFVGSTGRSTGPHLHYETRVNGQALDPRR